VEFRHRRLEVNDVAVDLHEHVSRQVVLAI
jgi:hypothetical protein